MFQHIYPIHSQPLCSGSCKSQD